MRKRNGYLMRGSLAAVSALGLLFLAGSGLRLAAPGLKQNNLRELCDLIRWLRFVHHVIAVSEPNPPAIPYAVSGTMVSNGKGQSLVREH